MKEIAVPSTAKQLKAQNILKFYRDSMLGDTLRKTVSTINPQILHKEIVDYVPTNGMKILQRAGSREEVAFALPCVLYKNPRLLGYYRLLMGISEKQFYTRASGLSSYKCFEHEGKIGHHSSNDIESLCMAINKNMDDFLSNANKTSLSEDLKALPLMTLGVYVDGVWRNIIGTQAANHVFDTIKAIVTETGADISDENDGFSFVNKQNENVTVLPASDPDISITKNDGFKLLCIEIKGGQDVANVHNRAGEAEKSHQKAKKDGWKETWTIIYLVGLQKEQRCKLNTESPSTDMWFDVNEICSRTGASFLKFKQEIMKRIGL